jgi:hypothetical protein
MHNIETHFKSNDKYLMCVNLVKSLQDDLISNMTTNVVNMILITSNDYNW